MAVRPLRRAEIEVRRSDVHGYGVFARRSFMIGELLEECHCLVLARGDQVDAHLENYVFTWPPLTDGRAVVFGSGSIFNHSSQPNADWEIDVSRGLYIFRAVREIAADAEVLIDYGWSPTD